MRFPSVSGDNLNREQMSLPDDLAGRLNLVFVAFQRLQQISVNTWVPFAADLETRFDGLRYYEVPTLSLRYRLGKAAIDGGMRGGIPDKSTRARTITVYIDKRRFRDALDIPDEDEIQVLLLDNSGEVIWRTLGEFSQEKADELEELVSARLDA